MRKTVFIVCFVVMAAMVFGAGSAVEPSSVAITNVRAEAQNQYISSAYYFDGTTLLFTNCVMYSGTSISSPRQGLSNVVIEVRIGSTSSNIAYTGYAQEPATNGVWWARTEVLHLPLTYLQVKITDEGTNSYIYPWKLVRTKEPLD